MYATYPIYMPSARYARENGEIGLWRESKKINLDLMCNINDNATNAYYDRLLPEFITKLIDTYGLERSMFVMARFIVAADWDERYDKNTKERAAQFDFQDMKEAERQHKEENNPSYLDRSGDLYSNVHPCILNDIFRSLMKMEQEQTNLPTAEVEHESEQGVDVY